MSIGWAYQIHNKLAGGGRHGTMGAWIPHAWECSRSLRLRPLSASPAAPSSGGCAAVESMASGSAPCGPSRPPRLTASRPKAAPASACPKAQSFPAATRAPAWSAARRLPPAARPASAQRDARPGGVPGSARPAGRGPEPSRQQRASLTARPGATPPATAQGNRRPAPRPAGSAGPPPSDRRTSGTGRPGRGGAGRWRPSWIFVRQKSPPATARMDFRPTNITAGYRPARPGRRGR